MGKRFRKDKLKIPYKKLHVPNYKVKAFLGDSILEYILTMRIYKQEFGTIGNMSKRLNYFKSNNYLAKIYSYIVKKKYLEEDDRNLNVHSKGSMVEAFICYMYQDKGLEFTEKVVNHLYDEVEKYLWRYEQI